MARRVLPAPLVLAALVADLGGDHGVALALLLLAIPAAGVLALESYGDVVEARCGLGRPIVAAGSLFLIVFSSALRSPAVVGGVPRIALSALVLAVGLSAWAAAAALLPQRRPVRGATVEQHPAEAERLAA
jgi:hypothetical protein